MQKRKIVIDEGKKNKKKLSRRGVIAIIIIIFAVAGILFFSVSQIIQSQQSKDPIPKLTPGKHGVASPDSDTKKYGGAIAKNANLTDSEVEKLHKLGYEDDVIQRFPPNYWYRFIYDSERSIQESYMTRYKSPYKNAKESTDDQRDELMQEMKDNYYSGNYEGVVKAFQNTLKRRTFEEYKDEPITSLYYDALDKIPSEKSDEIQRSDDDEIKNKAVEKDNDPLANNRQVIEDSMGTHRSEIATLYDLFNIDTTLTAKYIKDTNSCLPMSTLKTVDGPVKYDMHKYNDENPDNHLKPASEVPHKDQVSNDADVVYVYDCTDQDGEELTVEIETVGIKKDVIGVYYKNQTSCLYKTAVQGN